ncbi:MAG: hypothetical protein V3W18_08075 [candidate division Zixibacteria bacterium]
MSIISAKKIIASVSILAIALSSCIPGPKGTEKIPSPYDLDVKIVNRGADITWSVERGKNDRTYGYNIYLSEKSLKEDFRKWKKKRPKPHNFTPYPGDTDGDRNNESYEITHLENGKTYFVSIRTLGPDGVESKASNEVRFVPMAGGVFVISSNHSADNGGFEFDTGRYSPSRDKHCDLYFWTKGDQYGLSSPSRLGAGLRKTYFSKPGIINVREMETIKIKKGDKIIAESKRGRAEMTILRIGRRGSEAEATIEYIYYPKDNKR